MNFINKLRAADATTMLLSLSLFEQLNVNQPALP